MHRGVVVPRGHELRLRQVRLHEILAGGAAKRSIGAARHVEHGNALDVGDGRGLGEERLAGDHVRADECHPRVALRRDRHARHHQVHLALLESGEQIGEGHRDEKRLQTHGFGERFQQIDLEADDLTALVLHVERRLVAREADAELTALDDPVEPSRRRRTRSRTPRRKRLTGAEYENQQAAEQSADGAHHGGLLSSRSLQRPGYSSHRWGSLCGRLFTAVFPTEW